MFPSILFSVLLQALTAAHIKNGHTKEKYRREDKGKVHHH